MSKGPESRIRCASGWRLRCADPYPYSGGVYIAPPPVIVASVYPRRIGIQKQSSFDVTEFTQPRAQALEEVRVPFSRSRTEKPDLVDLPCLLGLCGERHGKEPA